MESYTNYSINSLIAPEGTDSLKNISIPMLGKTILLPTTEITCLEGEGNYTYIYSKTGKRYLVSRTMKSLVEQLDNNFLRIHKSYLINTNYVVERFDEDRVIRMSCGTKVTIARRKIKEITDILDSQQESLRA
jgi:two-component system LytT family response regulator